MICSKGRGLIAPEDIVALIYYCREEWQQRTRYIQTVPPIATTTAAAAAAVRTEGSSSSKVLPERLLPLAPHHRFLPARRHKKGVGTARETERNGRKESKRGLGM